MWLDAVGFALGLALAWHFQWETRDLVWSLWFASLTVGFATIVWQLFAPAWLLAREGQAGAAMFAVIGGVFLLAFFTFHFGLFHTVHAIFLNGFFPITAGRSVEFPPFGLLVEAATRYGWFLPAALLAERGGFRIAPLPPAPPATSVKAADIDARKARNAALGLRGGVMAPYANVVRLHLLIFFFAGAHFLKLDGFAVYAVVYAAYFFPWRVLRRARAEQA